MTIKKIKIAEDYYAGNFRIRSIDGKIFVKRELHIPTYQNFSKEDIINLYSLAEGLEDVRLEFSTEYEPYSYDDSKIIMMNVSGWRQPTEQEVKQIDQKKEEASRKAATDAKQAKSKAEKEEIATYLKLKKKFEANPVVKLPNGETFVLDTVKLGRQLF